jgi:hypothetical protein
MRREMDGWRGQDRTGKKEEDLLLSFGGTF